MLNLHLQRLALKRWIGQAKGKADSERTDQAFLPDWEPGQYLVPGTAPSYTQPQIKSTQYELGVSRSEVRLSEGRQCRVSWLETLV